MNDREVHKEGYMTLENLNGIVKFLKLNSRQSFIPKMFME